MGFFNTKNVSVWLRAKSRQPFVKFGLPFLLFMVGGSFGLREFTHLRYQYAKRETLKPSDLEPLGISMKKPGEVTLESEYEKIKNMDIDNWENVRGPRPWEQNQKTAT